MPRTRSFEELIKAYGDATFECGAWVDNDDETYETVHARSMVAHTNLVAALRKAGLPVGATS